MPRKRFRQGWRGAFDTRDAKEKRDKGLPGKESEEMHTPKNESIEIRTLY